MQEQSALQFTTEISVSNRIPFLDFDITKQDGVLKTKVYRKPTNPGRCMNAASECPSRYKASVIRSFIHRALKYCSDWDAVHHELQRCKQILVNNGYSNTDVDHEINRQMQQRQQPKPTDKRNTITVFYKNHMTPAYRVDERVLKNIIDSNVTCTEPSIKLDLVIFYKNTKVGGLVMRNNLTRDTSVLKKTNVIYQFSCPYEDCQLRRTGDYIGLTTTTLSRRLTMHLQNGAPSEHMLQVHKKHITRKDLTENTMILRNMHDKRRLPVLEALLIREKQPHLNKQVRSCVTLELFQGTA